MSVSDWHRQQLNGTAAIMQRLGLGPHRRAQCPRDAAAVIDVCRNCVSRDVCRGVDAQEDAVPEVRPAFCPKVRRLSELMAELHAIAPAATRH